MSRDLAVDASRVKRGNGNPIRTPPLAREVYGAPTPLTTQKGVAGEAKKMIRAAQS